MEARTAAVALGVPIDIVAASTIEEIDTTFAGLAQSPPDALVVNGNTLFNNRRVQIITLATHQRLPTIFSSRLYVEDGGLMSYGPLDNLGRQVGLYAGRILSGAKPADLPVMQAAKFEFVINMRTAKALGLTIPETLLATADKVIQ